MYLLQGKIGTINCDQGRYFGVILWFLLSIHKITVCKKNSEKQKKTTTKNLSLVTIDGPFLALQ